MRTEEKYLKEINRLLQLYLKEVSESNLKPLSAQMYQTQSINFVRWINGEFTPGGNARAASASKMESLN
ncbi:hypothetical protein DYBT9275_02505 [Dyadobacter sp. CECT 9275]|uniref:Uncharacterized protein n=1 Tax=Dyadobacter helix TaxID=2822344 RepID=A0A916JBF9_9BACT|nr:hypothetical protein [Dyadobacter sp. CECT 9275]CAG5000650.1 hypothetical protein DYBT9275_02505 [Dyadobacter sp. CECT 9275]